MHATDAALHAWRDALQLDPNDPDAHSGAGNPLAPEKRYEEAFPYLETAAKEQQESHDVELSNLLDEDLACTVKIGSFWDTLGLGPFSPRPFRSGSGRSACDLATNARGGRC